jgi:flagellar biosynthesis protein FlhB
MYNRLELLFETFFLNSGMALEDQDHAIDYLEQALVLGFEMMMPVMVMLLVTAVLVNMLQTGGVFSVKAIKPKGSKINPVNGLKRIFSMKGLVELAKGFLKLFIVSLVVYFTVPSP